MDIFWQIVLQFVVPACFVAASGIISAYVTKKKYNGNGFDLLKTEKEKLEKEIGELREENLKLEVQLNKVIQCMTCPIKLKD